MSEAISCFERVISINPNVIESYGALASCLIRTKHPEQAASICRRVISVITSHLIEFRGLKSIQKKDVVY